MNYHGRLTRRMGMGSTLGTAVTNPLSETIRWASDYQRNAETTWTYREVSIHVLSALDRTVGSGRSEFERRDAQNHLAYCLRLTRAVCQRDESLAIVASSVEHLMRCIDRANDLTTISVREAVEAVLLDVQFCSSQHE
jgi:hypothetical protein